MARPRETLVSLEDTPYYHCCSRVVRKAFLCGFDASSGDNYEHRREWVDSRILELATIFAIDICAYSVMSNHLHVVLKVDIDTAKNWSDFEVLTQWHKGFKGTLLTNKFVKGEVLNEFELQAVNDCITQYRLRLTDISWFMRSLCEPIARMANKEDNCTGRFWEGRFKSQALLDEAAVLACMAYVDLNPIRAKMATAPESSDYTSIQRRINSAMKGEQPAELLPFVGNERLDMPNGLMFSVKDYIVLVEDTGRIIRDDKRGAISASSQDILNRLNIPAENWLKITTEFGALFKGAVGALPALTEYCEHLERKRRQGAANCQRWLCA
ncbi:transposase [Pseudomonadota bacterium]|uniref:transposase n=1 Tax=unclassified Shewanella TaxID=196818 RepID=UPI000CCB2428|nr:MULTISPECIES: transposase [unclassified Shewanella]MDO6677083.1 transposase [Shewanella sp. 4_MG-2023]PMG28646.1 transposase [Shewanella sp. 10N.286.52.C2]